MSEPNRTSGVLVEAEAFDDLGGWVVDSQFESRMGSPYLLAHGLGRPVADATTHVEVPEAGDYTVWVRAKDWAPSGHPGRFTVSVNGRQLGSGSGGKSGGGPSNGSGGESGGESGTEFGADGKDWSWRSGGTVTLPSGTAKLTLHDLTGFDGRCDAIFLSRDGSVPPPEPSRAWRKALLGLPDEPEEAGEFDVVVVGGGVTGCTAALAAARLGCRVALIQDRPLLGGNASTEVGLTPRGRSGPLVTELCERADDGDLHAAKVLDAEPNVTLAYERRVFSADTATTGTASTDATAETGTGGTRIVSVVARAARTGREYRYRAPVFIDCTGTAILGLLTGARTLFGQEARAEYGERLAPRRRVEAHHGNTVFFRTRMADHPVPFPDVPWAREVAKGFANLGGQSSRPGVDNVAGPVAGKGPLAWFARTGHKGAPGRATVGKILRKLPESLRMRLNMRRFPATHFWEYGQWLDPYTEGEHIRDHLLCAIYGTFSNVKRREPATYANLELEWVAHVPGQGEFRRYLGDHVLTENDIRGHTEFPDAVVWNDGAFCLHRAGRPARHGPRRRDFRLKGWTWDTRDGKPYAIPFRCLYSADVQNLMMAGKHISVSHVAGSSTKFMANGAQHAIATAAAAYLCTKHDTAPRAVGRDHMSELRDVVKSLS